MSDADKDDIKRSLHDMATEYAEHLQDLLPEGCPAYTAPTILIHALRISLAANGDKIGSEMLLEIAGALGAGMNSCITMSNIRAKQEEEREEEEDG